MLSFRGIAALQMCLRGLAVSESSTREECKLTCYGGRLIMVNYERKYMINEFELVRGLAIPQYFSNSNKGLSDYFSNLIQ